MIEDPAVQAHAPPAGAATSSARGGPPGCQTRGMCSPDPTSELEEGEEWEDPTERMPLAPRGGIHEAAEGC